LDDDFAQNVQIRLSDVSHASDKLDVCFELRGRGTLVETCGWCLEDPSLFDGHSGFFAFFAVFAFFVLFGVFVVFGVFAFFGFFGFQWLLQFFGGNWRRV